MELRSSACVSVCVCVSIGSQAVVGVGLLPALHPYLSPTRGLGVGDHRERRWERQSVPSFTSEKVPALWFYGPLGAQRIGKESVLPLAAWDCVSA